MTPPTSVLILSRLVIDNVSYNDDLERFHTRKSPRIKHYDYASPNYYFVTICTHGKACLFGNPTQLNTFGKIAEHGLLEIEKHFSDVAIDKYVIMPNHIHAIIILSGHGTNLSTVIGLYKSFVSKQIHSFGPKRDIWQASFHDHIIRDQKGYEKIWLYIDANPANWEKDCFYLI